MENGRHPVGQSSDIPAQNIAVLFQGLKLLANGLLQMTARIDAVQEVVCELHPEVAARLEAKIQKAQSDTLKQFSELQRMLEFLGASTAGPTQ